MNEPEGKKTTIRRYLAPASGMILALRTNIRLGWKGLTGTDTIFLYYSCE
jgi:hypothetical protein